MTTMMTVTDPDWSHDEVTRGWEDDPTSAPYAAVCADTEHAWLINNTHAALPGWQFEDGTFSGPYYDGVLAVLNQLVSEAVDFVISVLDEITGGDED